MPIQDGYYVTNSINNPVYASANGAEYIPVFSTLEAAYDYLAQLKANGLADGTYHIQKVVNGGSTQVI